jgi:hypothetical protein
MLDGDWSSDVCSSDLAKPVVQPENDGNQPTGTGKGSTLLMAL